MSLGRDQQYDETWIEQDKVRRRLEIKRALKLESIQLRYNPFFHMKDKPVLDPAIDRYMDTRKKGRLPNAPFNPKLFFTMFSLTFVPIFIVYAIVEWERRPYVEALNKGDYPLEDRLFKHQA